MLVGRSVRVVWGLLCDQNPGYCKREGAGCRGVLMSLAAWREKPFYRLQLLLLDGRGANSLWKVQEGSFIMLDTHQ